MSDAAKPADLTLMEWEALIGEAYRLDQEIEALERDTMAPIKKRLAEVEAKILGHLTANEMSSYKSKHGTVVRMRRYSVRVPADASEKEKFFTWLHNESTDLYWRYTTVNSQALNALYKERMELAKEAGDIDFAIPGIGEPTLMETLSMRKR